MESLRRRGYSMYPAPENEANMFYARTETEYKSEGHIGYLRFDFGKSGEEFWHTWHPFNEMLNTECFKQDFYRMMDILREGPLQNRVSMRKYIDSHGGRLAGREDWFGFIIESERYRYYARLFPLSGDYNGYIFAYEK